MQDNPKYVRTVYFKLNPFTNQIDRHFSNDVYSTPPEGVEELPPNLMRYVGGMSNPLPYTIWKDLEIQFTDLSKDGWVLDSINLVERNEIPDKPKSLSDIPDYEMKNYIAIFHRDK